MLYSIAILVSGLSFPALAAPPVRVYYQRTGKESREAASILGNLEVEKNNPCVIAMKRQLEDWIKTPAAKDTLKSVKKHEADIAGTELRWALYYSAGRMEVLLENDSTYRKGLVLSNEPSNWKKRMKNGECTLTEKSLSDFSLALREQERLQICILRKLKLIEKAEPVQRIATVDFSPEKLSLSRAKIGSLAASNSSLLVGDLKLYREGNSNIRKCQKSLNRLENDAAATVVTLRAAGLDDKQGNIVRALEQALQEETPTLLR